jgi:hypothetical protein
LLPKSPQLHIGLLHDLHGSVVAADWRCAASLNERQCKVMRQPVFACDAFGFKLFKAGDAVVVLIIIDKPLQMRGGANVCEYRGECAGARGIGGRWLAGCAHFCGRAAAEARRCSRGSIADRSFWREWVAAGSRIEDVRKRNGAATLPPADDGDA